MPRIPSRPSGLASTDPGPENVKANRSRGASPLSTTPASEGPSGRVEVLRIGDWSVQRLSDGDGDQSPVYVHLKTGQVQTEPPPEVLAELANDVDVDDCIPEEGEEGREEEERDDLEAAELEDYFPSGSRPGSAAQSSGPPRFRRIILGNGNAMPLRMARDLLTALREDATLFDQLQQRFSDLPSEPVLQLHPGANGRPVSPAPGAPPPPLVPPELEAAAAALQLGELSEVLGTDSGMQILLRVS